jgi:hypothetical protein
MLRAKNKPLSVQRSQCVLRGVPDKFVIVAGGDDKNFGGIFFPQTSQHIRRCQTQITVGIAEQIG